MRKQILIGSLVVDLNVAARCVGRVVSRCEIDGIPHLTVRGLGENPWGRDYWIVCRPERTFAAHDSL